MKKFLIFCISVFVIVNVVWYVYKLPREVSNTEFNKIIAEKDFGKSKIIVREKYMIYGEIHEMANTLIVAEEIWGEITITEEKVNGLIIELEKSDLDTKEMLLDILYRWKKGNFSNGVNDHNYVWNLLNGNVGSAYKLRPEIRQSMFKKGFLDMSENGKMTPKNP